MPKQKPGDLPSDSQLRKRMNSERLNRGMSWEKFATLLELGTSTVIHICKGHTSPHDTTKAKIVRQLNAK